MAHAREQPTNTASSLVFPLDLAGPLAETPWGVSTGFDVDLLLGVERTAAIERYAFRDVRVVDALELFGGGGEGTDVDGG